MKLRVGLVGVGDAWESRHCPALRALSDRFQVRAVCCEIALRAEMVAKEFGAIPIDGFRAMMAMEDIDAILALAPDWVGTLPILAACEAGKAVYASASLDIDMEQAIELKKRVETSGVAFMAEMPRRHAPATLRLKELIATKLGRPRMLFCHQRNLCNGKKRKAEQCPTRTTTSRELMELVDWCRYVVDGDPCSVLAIEHRSTVSNARADYQFFNVEFADKEDGGGGGFAQISIGEYVPSRWQEAVSYRRPASLQVCCEHGIAFLDLPTTVIWFDDAGQHMESLESDRPVGEQMLTHFHRSVTSLIRKTSDLEDAYRAQSVILAATESAQTGKRIDLSF